MKWIKVKPSMFEQPSRDVDRSHWPVSHYCNWCGGPFLAVPDDQQPKDTRLLYHDYGHCTWDYVDPGLDRDEEIRRLRRLIKRLTTEWVTNHTVGCPRVNYRDPCTCGYDETVAEACAGKKWPDA